MRADNIVGILPEDLVVIVAEHLAIDRARGVTLPCLIVGVYVHKSKSQLLKPLSVEYI